jgi:hypothetical protein
VAGSVTGLGSGSFTANAYVVTPGPGNSGTAPATTVATILTGSSTKVITYGQSGITAGDDFYAVYKGVSSSTPLSTLETDTPSVVYAYAAPTPEVEVKGVVTTAPASGSDTFTSTAYVVTPPKFHPLPAGGGWGGGGGAYVHGSGDGYSYGGGIGGGYGFTPTTAHARGAHVRRSNCLPGSTPASQGTPNTAITTDGSTKVTVNGQTSSVSNLVAGDKFTAIFDGTPNEPLSTVTATPAVSVAAYAAAPTPNVLYGFVGTVASTTSSSVTVNVSNSIPSALFSGTDTFTVGSSTIVLGNSGSSLSSVAPGDVVAGGLLGPSGQSASTIESDPLQVLVDFPASLSPGSSTSSTSSSTKRAERKALKSLRQEKAKLGRHHKKHNEHQK